MITPPPELVQQWASTFYEITTAPGDWAMAVATQAARWGADMELNECCHLLRLQGFDVVDDLRAARRPKPPSLNSIALQMLGTIERDAHYLPEITDTIRKALEALAND